MVPGTQRYTEVHTGTHRYTQVHAGTHRYTQVHMVYYTCAQYDVNMVLPVVNCKFSGHTKCQYNPINISQMTVPG